MSFLRRAAIGGALASLCLFAGVRDADACGGCFHPAAETSPSVVTDHRMAFKISTRETILWDQVRYAGDPTEFAWVLPVRAGAVVELSHDEIFGALDRSTRTTVTGPEVFCNQPSSSSSSRSSSRSSSSSNGGGCGGGSTETYDDGYASGSSDNASFGGDAGATFTGNEQVEVVDQSVIGPYRAVTLHANGGVGIAAWLTDNGFAIPDGVRPTVEAYTREGFDFIALRLRPGANVRAMRPVRVVTPGADPTLPLRMVAAGVGSHVGLTLWVLGEGRYHTASFPDAPIDWSRLAWDPKTSRSNMTELVKAALASNGGRSWITEAAVKMYPYGTSNRTFAGAYENLCSGKPARVVPCDADENALPPPDGTPQQYVPPDPDAGADASTDDAGDADADASIDAGSDAGVQCTKVVSGCDGYDDVDVVMRGLHAGDFWVTRLRADLPVSALDADLRLEAAPGQVEDDPQRHTEAFTDPSFDPCASTRASATPSRVDTGCACRTTRMRRDAGTWVVIAVTAMAVSAIARRRRR